MADRKYTVKQGESISSIAYTNDFFPETIWNHPDNAELKKTRVDPNALYPGDIVVIPEKDLKEENCAPEQRHRFRRKGVPAKLQIQFLDEEGKPRAEIPYILDIKTKSGRVVPFINNKTNEQGYLKESIPPDAAEGKLTVGEGEEQEVHKIKLGHIDPIDTISGVQARLNNMGFVCGKEDGKLNIKTRLAVEEFQAKYKLKPLDPEAEEIDRETLDKIDAVYSGS
jgi:N-acetylmuramoyl-L-alanine amidase